MIMAKFAQTWKQWGESPAELQVRPLTSPMLKHEKQQISGLSTLLAPLTIHICHWGILAHGLTGHA